MQQLATARRVLAACCLLGSIGDHREWRVKLKSCRPVRKMEHSVQDSGSETKLTAIFMWARPNELGLDKGNCFSTVGRCFGNEQARGRVLFGRNGKKKLFDRRKDMQEKVPGAYRAATYRADLPAGQARISRAFEWEADDGKCSGKRIGPWPGLAWAPAPCSWPQPHPADAVQPA